MTLFFQRFYSRRMLVVPMWRILLWHSAGSLALSRSMLSLALTNDAMRLIFLFYTNYLVTWHLYHITFMMMMMSQLENVVTCRIMSNVREKSGHVTCTLFSNVVYIKSHDDTAKHAMTCCVLSRHVLEKSLITLSNKAIDACEIANVAFLLYWITLVMSSREASNNKYDAANT